MNTSQKLLLAGVSAISVTSVASGAIAAGNSATTSASASVTVFQPIAVSKVSNLQFGRVIRPSSGSNTFSVAAADGTTSVAGAGDGIFSGSTTPTAASFKVTGEGGQGFGITTDPSVTNNGLTITLVSTSATSALDGSIGGTGTATFGVGGSVVVSNTSSTGTASGSFNVTVTYQ